MLNTWILLLTFQNLASYFTGRIAPDEHVVFFPTSASQWNSTHWYVPIHGWIFQPKESSLKRKAFLSLLRRFLKVPPKSTEERILHRRIKTFVVDNERWKRPKITICGKQYSMAPSSRNGHFRTSLILPEKDIALDYSSSSLSSTRTTPSTLRFFAASSQGESRYEGMVHLVPPEGITILSDVDDTIKVTNVVNKQEMLRNTFLRDFEAVPGMAQVYQNWCSSSSSTTPHHGDPAHVHLHFLSASLYQLYEELEHFRETSGFPMATYSLKIVRPKKAKEMIRVLLEDAMDYKRRVLQSIFEMYPRRQFVLVGDTGEKDPQVYASMAREFPNQVMRIYLRHVAKQPEDDVLTRVQQTMNEYGIEDAKWTVFADANTLLSIDLQQIWLEHRTNNTQTLQGKQQSRLS